MEALQERPGLGDCGSDCRPQASCRSSFDVHTDRALVYTRRPKITAHNAARGGHAVEEAQYP